jgi:hypothetical protein
MPSFFQIVANTPLWVWPLMLFVLWLGWRGLQPRILPVGRLAVLPLVGVGTSATGIAQSMQPRLAVLGWSVALLAALPLGYLIGSRRSVRPLGGGRIEIAGGWFVLVFAVSIFAVRYTLGVLFGAMPALRAETFWIVLSGGVGGIVTGIGVGWIANLLRRAYRPAVLTG